MSQIRIGASGGTGVGGGHWSGVVTNALTTGRTDSGLMVSGGAVVVVVTGVAESRFKPGATNTPNTGTTIAAAEMAAITAMRILRLRRRFSLMMGASYLCDVDMREITRRW
jgi:hypothetical protein